MRSAPLLLIALLCTAPAAAAQPRAARGDTAAALAAHRAWWRAFTVGDTARLGRSTAPDLSLTLSTGETFDLAGALGHASDRGDSMQVQLTWSDESAKVMGGAAVVTSRVAERIGRNEAFFRWITVLHARNGGWQAVAAQSTRLHVPAPSVAIDRALLSEYAGRYRLPNGATLQVAARDSMLALTTPDGMEQLLAPISAAVFELRTSRARQDLVRFVFERDTNGRIARLTRLAPTGAIAFARIP